MTSTFINLPPQKRGEIMNACIEEFALAGYEQASTNRIVNRLGISKGSLFKYFQTKEEIYFDIIDYSLSKFYEAMKDKHNTLPAEWFARIRRITEIYIDFYAENPSVFRLIITLQERGAVWVQDKLMTRLAKIARDIFFKMFEGADISHLNVEMDEAIQMFQWLVTGLNSELFYNHNRDINPKTAADIYMKEFDASLDVLKNGCYRKGAIS